MAKKYAVWSAVGILGALILVIGILSLINGYFILAPRVQMELVGSAEMEIAAHSSFLDEGVTAHKGRNDLSSLVVTEGEVDPAVPGSYVITYRLTVGNREYVQTRTVNVVDKESPALELNGELQLTIAEKALYQEPGFTATDRCDGDLTEKVKISEALDGDTLTITYTVHDAAGNESSAQRVVTIRDEITPVITLYGYSTVYVPVGGVYREPGCSAADNVDGDLTSAVSCSGSVNTAAPGSYTLHYQVSDRAGNKATASRTVKVYAGNSSGAGPVYLTFDDGPSSNVTPRILDILAANKVKATFFILDYSAANRHLVARMINEGHTVGIHGYSHDYATIYASDEAFMDNVYRLRDKLRNDFGYEATLLRFPGGSSNTVSRAYSQGIMTRLAKRVQEEGFVYFDWNVSSGDANAGGLSKAQIYHNVTGTLQPGRHNVVLMHDSGVKSTTADALQDIIHYARGNGYSLLPLSRNVPAVHQWIAN